MPVGKTERVPGVRQKSYYDRLYTSISTVCERTAERKAEADCLRLGRGLLRPLTPSSAVSPPAEVKREGFYEAVTADKVSLRPHRRVYSGTVPKWLFDSTYPGVVHSLTFSRWHRCDSRLYLKPFTRLFSVSPLFRPFLLSLSVSPSVSLLGPL